MVEPVTAIPAVVQEAASVGSSDHRMCPHESAATHPAALQETVETQLPSSMWELCQVLPVSVDVHTSPALSPAMQSRFELHATASSRLEVTG